MATPAELDITYKHFLDRSTLLFGESKTGKSFIMVDILYQLQPYVDQIIVFSPTDRQNNTYDNGMVPLPCIHYTITPEILSDVWQRQEALANTYTEANNPVILKSLFDKIQSNHHQVGIINTVNGKLRTYKDELKSATRDRSGLKVKIVEMENECKKLISMIWKQSINENRGRLRKLNLTAAEHKALKYLNLNPRLVMIFDDCTEIIKKIQRNPVVQKLFYQGRHVFITTIIACHTDKALDPELKKNAFVTIFTEETCARSYIDRPSNDMNKDAKRRAHTACKGTFTPLAEFQKLAWVRDEKTYYRLTATKHDDFRFGCKQIWDYCDRIKSDGMSLSATNKFIGDFT